MMKKSLLLAVVVGMLSAAPAFSNDERHVANTAAQQGYMVKGEVVAVNAAANKVKLKHEAVPALNWPGMTMDFAVADRSVLKGVQAGQKVEFQFDMASGAPRVTRITPVK